MSKSKRQLLQELLELEDKDLGDVGNNEVAPAVKKDSPILINDCITPSDDESPITKPKKQLTEKQLEALKKGQQKRNENREQNKLIKQQKEEEERKILEAKLVKKAISIKKKQIKKQAVLDEISDDETEGATPPSQPHNPTNSGMFPIQKIKEISAFPSKGDKVHPISFPAAPSVPKIMFV